MYLDFPTMATLDAASEWRRLSEHYRSLTDEELLELSGKDSDLTDVAKQALAQEIAQRRLKPLPQESPPPVDPDPPPDDLYAQERELVDLCSVWSLSDALQLQDLLDHAGVPFCVGPKKSTRIDPGTMNFANAIAVQVMRIGLPLASQALQRYRPENDLAPNQQETGEDLAVHCPRCHSTDVIFEHLAPDPANDTDPTVQKFDWTCASCGHQWEDEGVETNS